MEQRPPSMHRIRASAGSGKTYELTSRFVGLLSGAAGRGADGIPSDDTGRYDVCFHRSPDGVYSWREICAVTFTNRAAEEMRDRIIRRLKELALELTPATKTTPTPAQAEAWVPILLERYSALNVRTIDSLLHMIVRGAALDLGLPPEIEPSFDDTATALDPLIDLLIANTLHDSKLAAIISKGCADYATRKTDEKALLPKHKLRKATAMLVLRMQTDAAYGLLSDYADSDNLEQRLQQLCTDLNHCSQRLLLELEQRHLELTVRFADFLKKCAADSPDIESIAKSVFAKSTRPLADCLKKTSKNQINDTVEALYAGFTGALRILCAEVPLILAGQAYAPFLPFAQNVLAEIPSYLLATGRIHQSLMALYAKKALESNGCAELYCRLGGGPAHLLIDEFQDTATDQWNAVKPIALDALSRGGSFTWVGDVKQAIYGWRGGNAGLFDEILVDQELTSVAPDPEQGELDANWRSGAEIVRFNNTVFSRLACKEKAAEILNLLLGASASPSVCDEAQTLAATFAHTAQRPAADSHGREQHPGGFVQLASIQGNTTADLNEKVRCRLLDILRNDILRRRPPGDVAVLVRANSQAGLAAEWLTGAGIPVVTENSYRLNDHPLVKEVLAVLAFSETPEDDSALWTIVSGRRLLSADRPAIEACLFTDRGDKPFAATLRDECPSVWQRLESLLPRGCCAYDAIANTLTFSGVLQNHPEDGPFAERLLEIAYLASNEGYASVAAFLEYWAENAADEKAPVPASPDAIRIMTIHKAKGLEFPVVIVPWNSLGGRAMKISERRRLGNGLLVLAPSAKGSADFDRLTASAVRESLHLAYVAWTRPSEELHAFLTSSENTGSSSMAFDSLLKDIPLIWGSRPQNRHTDACTAVQHAFNEPVNSESKKTNAATSGGVSATSYSGIGLPWMPNPDVARNTPETEAARSGTLTHLALERLRVVSNPEQALEQAIARLNEPVSEKIITAVRRRLNWFLTIPDSRTWLDYGASEQSVADAAGNLHRPDLIVRRNGTITVVDYKTGHRHPAHIAQVRSYLHILKNADPDILSIHGILVYLDEQTCLSVFSQEENV